MRTSDKLTPSMLITLGLTGVISTAARCGPCLKYAPEDTAEERDSGDTAEDDDRALGDRRDAARRVLERGVLPEDVAALLSARARDPS